MKLITGLPKKWRYVKLDLFDNATVDENIQEIQKFKLAISVKPENGSDWLYFRAALNSPRKHYMRLVKNNEKFEAHLDHYHTVLAHYDDARENLKSGELERVNVSKVYQKGWAESKQVVPGFSAMLMKHADGYGVQLFVANYTVYVELETHAINGNQRKKNIIASSSFSNVSGYTFKSIEDFI